MLLSLLNVTEQIQLYNINSSVHVSARLVSDFHQVNEENSHHPALLRDITDASLVYIVLEDV